MTRVLVVTNDFPPRQGGIESFVSELTRRLRPEDVVVYARGQAGDAAYDAHLAFPVIRHREGLMVPAPRLARRAAEIARAERCDSVWFGAATPLGLLAPGLRRAGVTRTVGSTHGHDVWWARSPGARQVLRHIGTVNDVLTYLADYTRAHISPALTPAAISAFTRLAPGVDTATFRPDCGGDDVRRRLGLASRPVAVCVSRLVPRKGQDVLIRAWPQVRRRVPGAALLLVGGGSHEQRLRDLARDTGVAADVVFAGAVPQAELAAHVGAGDVFAMPCRSRRAGLEVEGLGIVYLEAAACGLPVVAGDSGGAPDAVREGVTGHVVDGRDVDAVARRVAGLLADPDRAREMGRAGRTWVVDNWQWEGVAAALAALLEPR